MPNITITHVDEVVLDELRTFGLVASEVQELARFDTGAEA